MSGDLATLVSELSPYVTSAVSAYGAAVLVQAQDDAAEATVGWGRRILQRIFGIRQAGEPLPRALAELAGDPEDADPQAVLRVRIRRLLAEDAALVEAVRGLLAGAVTASAGVVTTASGERAVAAHTITGSVYTGDNHTPTR